MWIEDEELQIFCNLLTEAYIDSFIEPSVEWTQLASKDLEKQFERFKKKKQQIEKNNELEKRKPFKLLHFWFSPEKVPIQLDETVFNVVKKFLKPGRYIQNALEYKKAHLALRWMLEDSGCYIPTNIQKKLMEAGIFVDTSTITEWDKRHIAIQATAQVIGYSQEYFNIQKIKEGLINLDEGMKLLLRLDEWSSMLNYDAQEEGFEPKDRAKTIERFIATVNPIPPHKRRGRRPVKLPIFQEVIFIPGIFIEDEGVTKTHFCRLRVAIDYLAAILSFRGHSYQKIITHPIVLKYRNKLPPFFHDLVEVWVAEAVQEMDDFFKCLPQRFS